LLGVDPSIEFSEVVSVPVQLGDVLLLLTDGLTEAMNAKRELFGNDRLVEVLRHQRRNSAQEIIDGIFRAIDDFAGTKTHEDDLTAVAIKITE
jgi:serine phosphatase RsbU (regulator of sigma subunit)